MTRTSLATGRARIPGRHRLIAAIATPVVAIALSVTAFQPTAFGCDELRVPSLELSRCVVDGGQPEVDAGLATRLTGQSNPTVHWIAGHRTSNGSTFGQLTDLRQGASVRYRGLDYRVVEYRLIDRRTPGSASRWVLTTEPTVVLQTSAYDTFVHVWRAVATTAPTAAEGPVATVTSAAPTGTTGPPPGTTGPVGSPLGVSVITPTRILDTRTGQGTLAARVSHQVSIPPGRGVPIDAAVIFANMTVIGRDGPGFLTAFTCGQPQPETSSANWTDGVPVANFVVVPVVDGHFCVAGSSAADLVIDVMAYGSTTSRQGFRPGDHVRLLDTRDGTKRLGNTETRRVEIDTSGNDMPLSAAEVTVTGRGNAPGFFTVHPCDRSPHATSTLNPYLDYWTANTVLVPVDRAASFCVTSYFPGATQVDVVIDLHGTFIDGGARFQRLRPTRLVDTRRNDYMSLHRGARGSVTNSVLRLPGSGWRGIPESVGLVVNVTTTDSGAVGNVAIWPCSASRTESSIQNPRPGGVTASMVSVMQDGELCARSLTPAHLIVDVLGSWVSS